MNNPIPSGVIALRNSQHLSTIPLDIWRTYAAAAKRRENTMISLWSGAGIGVIGTLTSGFNGYVSLMTCGLIVVMLCFALSVVLHQSDRRVEREFRAIHKSDILSPIPAALNPISTFPTGAQGVIAIRNIRSRQRAEELEQLVRGIDRLSQTTGTPVNASKLTSLVLALDEHMSMPRYDGFASEFANTEIALPEDIQQRVDEHGAWRTKNYRTHDAVLKQILDLEGQLNNMRLQEKLKLRQTA